MYEDIKTTTYRTRAFTEFVQEYRSTNRSKDIGSERKDVDMGNRENGVQQRKIKFEKRKCGRCGILLGEAFDNKVAYPSIEKEYPDWVCNRHAGEKIAWSGEMYMKQEETKWRCERCYQNEASGKIKKIFCRDARNKNQYQQYFKKEV